jgi:phosphoribosylaminoimidazole-succinocarboxamide synthase
VERDRLREIAADQLSKTLDRTDFSELGQWTIKGRIEGKVRDSYVTTSGERILVVTDRLSAFDRVITTIPFKGQVLNQIAAYWFEESAQIAPNHVIKVPDPVVTIARECKPLSAEFVMRGYLTGTTSTSIWKAYERGDREFCGQPLPDGMVRHQEFSRPILTPSTKAPSSMPGEHDVSVSREQLLEMRAVTAEEFDRAADIAARLFEFGQARAAERGMILVDTKYEIGVTGDGDLAVIDEIHTPDSSRYWYADDYDQRMAAGEHPRSLDKEYVRRWLADEAGYTGDGPIPEIPDEVRIEAALRYIEIYELITGRPFVPDTSDPKKRIASNLEKARV